MTNGPSSRSKPALYLADVIATDAYGHTIDASLLVDQSSVRAWGKRKGAAWVEVYPQTTNEPPYCVAVKSARRVTPGERLLSSVRAKRR